MNKILYFILFTVLISNPVWAGNNKQVEEGRYLVTIGGCNDCHTSGYLLNGGNVPVSTWLTGDSFGWNGPWGTTYPSNLRLFISRLTEDQWVKEAKTLKRKPPMPWFNLNIMKEKDLRAIYQFVKSLGAVGKQAPASLPPGETPPMPYAKFPSPPPVAKK